MPIMSILNVYVKKEDKTTWIEMDTFPLIYTTLSTKINIFVFLSTVDQLQLKNIFFVKTLKITKICLL